MLRPIKHQARSQRGILAVFAAILLLTAGAASAAPSESTRVYNQTLKNQCNGEDVVFDGQEHIVDNTKTTPSGMHVNTMRRISGRGVGNVTSAQYTVGDSVKANIKTPPGQVIIRTWTKAISQGNKTLAPDFWQQSMFHINPDGSTGGTKFDSRCKPE